MTMPEKLVGQLVPALDANPIALVKRQRMLGRLDGKQRSQTRRARLHGEFEVDGARINRNWATKPSEVLWVRGAIRSIPTFGHVEKTPLAQGRPNRKGERVRKTKDWNLDVAADEKLLLVHDALVGAQCYAQVELVLGNERSPWCPYAKA